jgi:UDPglucose--hexose-1-phosphate uridylyltransferase
MPGLKQHPHRRLNPLTGEWLLISPHRTQRPWQGQVETPSTEKQLAYDPNCYLCPGNQRAGGHRNPEYAGTFVFVNDYSALYPLSADQEFEENTCDLIVARSEPGICRVMCFSPRHDLTLATMEFSEIRNVVDVWAEQYQELGSLESITHVQIFENRGAMMGASNSHPHCQIWANATIPNEPAKETEKQKAYLESHKICLLCNYLRLEIESQERIIYIDDHFIALVPFWAIWPFEVMRSRWNLRVMSPPNSRKVFPRGDDNQATFFRSDCLLLHALPVWSCRWCSLDAPLFFQRIQGQGPEF